MRKTPSIYLDMGEYNLSEGRVLFVHGKEECEIEVFPGWFLQCLDKEKCWFCVFPCLSGQGVLQDVRFSLSRNEFCGQGIVGKVKISLLLERGLL